MKNTYILFVLCFLTVNTTRAQQIDLPNVIPPSPDAASITSYVDVNIDEFTGAVSQEIPIFNFKNGNISIPISMNYRSSGFRVNTTASWVGLGWSLHSGGVVTRTVQGVPDDYKSGSDLSKGFLEFAVVGGITFDYLFNPVDQSQTRFNLLKDIAVGCADAQPDIFSFNFAGYQGKFHFDWDGSLVVDSNEDIDIEIIWSNGVNSKINGFKFTTGNGTKYTFSAAETTNKVSGSFASCQTPFQNFSSAWYPSEISSYNNSKKILFEYDPYTIQDHYFFQSEMNRHKLSASSDCTRFQTFENVINSPRVNINGKRLKRIYTSDTKNEIVFVPGAARTDLLGTNLYSLGEIQISDSTDLIKKVQLRYSYSTGRLTLTDLQEYGKNNGSLPPYKFYYTGTLPPRNSKKRDHWGFKNNNSGTEIFPEYSVNPGGGSSQFFGGADREPDFNGSMSGVMHKIEYPTGGFDLYTFENHEYGYVGSAKVNDYVLVPAQPINFKSYGPTRVGCDGVSTNINSATFTVDPIPAGVSETTVPVKVYSKLSLYTDTVGGSYFGAGQAPTAEILDGQGQVVYSTPINQRTRSGTIDLAPGTYTAKTTATWATCDDPPIKDFAEIEVTFGNYSSEPVTTKIAGGVRIDSIAKYDHSGQKLLEYHYDYDMPEGRSSGVIHKMPAYVYEVETYTWVAVGSFNSGYQSSCNFAIALDSDVAGLGLTDGSHIGYKNVTVTQGNGSNGKTEYSFPATANFVFNSFPFAPPINHSYKAALVDSIVTKNTLGDSEQKQLFKYKRNEEYTNALKVHWKGGSGIPGIENKFSLGAYQILIAHAKTESEKKEDYVSTNPFTTETVYSYDDKVHKIKQINEQDSRQDYERIQRLYYPEDISQLSNVSTSEQTAITALKNQKRTTEVIQTESYLKDDLGSEVLLGTKRNSYKVWANSIVEIDSIWTLKGVNTNVQSRVVFDLYDDKGNPLQLSPADGPKTSYIWGYNEMYPVAKVENASYSQIEGILGVNFDLGAGGLTPTQESNLRSGLQDAMITTYSYDPMVGITSITDPRGYTITYIYDDFNRLKEVRDADNKLLSDYQYHYKNQN
ncbi:RHS repeat domain-containing protein [Poritiphilus flavus]|uniref:YD repeat-containing protein n=1 Tax=Poritiphilus flavus TaxID=2697053 RepID=A0A6L9ED67_9FLAO|nr:RHS repeat domain-containing protein [Poritiphilus flavus]NAS12675.1 hypothetical protein [Poritiphilus flavus]